MAVVVVVSLSRCHCRCRHYRSCGRHLHSEGNNNLHNIIASRIRPVIINDWIYGRPCRHSQIFGAFVMTRRCCGCGCHSFVHTVIEFYAPTADISTLRKNFVCLLCAAFALLFLQQFFFCYFPFLFLKLGQELNCCWPQDCCFNWAHFQDNLNCQHPAPQRSELNSVVGSSLHYAKDLLKG